MKNKLILIVMCVSVFCCMCVALNCPNEGESEYKCANPSCSSTFCAVEEGGTCTNCIALTCKWCEDIFYEDAKVDPIPELCPTCSAKGYHISYSFVGGSMSVGKGAYESGGVCWLHSAEGRIKATLSGYCDEGAEPSVGIAVKCTSVDPHQNMTQATGETEVTYLYEDGESATITISSSGKSVIWYKPEIAIFYDEEDIPVGVATPE